MPLAAGADPDTQSTPAKDWARKLASQYAFGFVLFDTDGAQVFRSEPSLKAFHIHSMYALFGLGGLSH